MSKGKKAGIIVACIVAATVVVIILMRSSVLSPLGPLGSTVNVDYEPIMYSETAYLNVRVEGPEKTYKIILFNPEVVKVGEALISSDDMIPGYATAKVNMITPGYKENPLPGEYWLLVYEEGLYEDERVFESKPVFQGPNVSIMDVEFETHYTEYYGFTIRKVIARVYNSGDLPVFPDEIKLLIAGQETSTYLVSSIPHGETSVTEWLLPSTGYLERGTYPAAVQIYLDEAKLDTYQTHVQLGDNGLSPEPRTYSTPPPMVIDTSKQYTATIETEKGNLVLELFATDVPITVNNFVFLAREGFYDGLTFHRVVADFVVQGGCPLGNGYGGPGYQFDDEITEHTHVAGALSMANSGENTNGSQFFITLGPQHHLDGHYSVFGQLVEGMDVLEEIEQGDIITSLAIEEK